MAGRRRGAASRAGRRPLARLCLATTLYMPRSPGAMFAFSSAFDFRAEARRADRASRRERAGAELAGHSHARDITIFTFSHLGDYCRLAAGEPPLRPRLPPLSPGERHRRATGRRSAVSPLFFTIESRNTRDDIDIRAGASALRCRHDRALAGLLGARRQLRRARARAAAATRRAHLISAKAYKSGARCRARRAYRAHHRRARAEGHEAHFGTLMRARPRRL